MRVAIAYDGSEYAKAAVDDLQRSGLPPAVHALVISVGEPLLPLVPVTAINDDATLSRRVLSTQAQARAQAAQALQDARALAEEGSERTQRLFPGWDVHTSALLGLPAAMLIEKAEQWSADLIVVGSHGRSVLGRLIIGSVSKEIATESSRSVLVARHVVAWGDRPIRIIVAVDGSPGAETAIRGVSARTWPERTEVRVMAVDDTLRPTGTLKLVPQAAASVRESNEASIAKAREMMERAAEGFQGSGLRATAVLKNGSPPRILCDEARRWEADCIFVGSRGFSSTFERFRTGSVSTAVVTTAPCSVEIVR